MSDIKLTTFSKGSGCGCKIGPAVLREIIGSTSEWPPHPNVLVGNETNDDAAVIELPSGECLISTTDFFMPIVDNASDFGKIAAANALSDVYAMGGKPILALAILGWPVDKLAASLANEVLNGARTVCEIAGISLAGGHSIDSPEPFFGLSVNGLVNKNHLKQNKTAQEGDLLYLTKPIGTGIITAAQKRNVALQEDMDTAIRFMIRLNSFGQAVAKLNSVHALTDVTGFGLLGHLMEMCQASEVSAELVVDQVPLLPNLKHYTDQWIYPDMTTKNFAAHSAQTEGLNAQNMMVCCDPQTSGGLLIALDKSGKQEYLQLVSDFGLQGIADKPIGTIVAKNEKRIYLL